MSWMPAVVGLLPIIVASISRVKFYRSELALYRSEALKLLERYQELYSVAEVNDQLIVVLIERIAEECPHILQDPRLRQAAFDFEFKNITKNY